MTIPEAAVLYARRGWAVFPCQVRGKIPACAHGVKDASADPGSVAETWRQAPAANIGLATGTVSGIMVVDLDGQEGVDTWRRLAERHGHVRTMTGRTGSGGWHLVYRLPAGVTVRNTARRIGPGVDTRGDGGYIVAPPSIHPCGGIYWWADEREPETAPGWLVGLLSPPVARPPAVPRRELTDGDGTRYGIAALRRIVEDLSAAREGTRNHALNTAAYAVGQLVAGGELRGEPATDALVRVAKTIGLTEGEIVATMRSGVTAGYGRPRSAA